MKLTILGAASPRFPLLLKSLLKRENLSIDRVCLFDLDREKLGLLSRTLLPEIMTHATGRFDLSAAATIEEAFEGADYVFSSIRVGGQHRRALDETHAVELGEIGQETVGIGGFLSALRTIPVMLEHVDFMQRYAPGAMLINFTNPSGIVTQAVHSLSGFSGIVGICDAPQMVATYTAEIYDVDPSEVQILSYGLNHYGWVYSVQVQGIEVLDQLLDCRREEFFAKEPFYKDLEEEMLTTRSIPNEYLYYYTQRERVLANQRNAPLSRAQTISRLDDELYQTLARGTLDPIRAFNEYMDQRNSSYMMLESGKKRSQPVFSLLDQENANGYDAIALDVLGIASGVLDRQMILNIPNNGFDPALRDEDVIEVSARRIGGRFRAQGSASALHPSSLKRIRALKEYERLVIEAVANRSDRAAIQALEANPLIRTDPKTLWRKMGGFNE